jgi:anti-sigma regulatory factor (Ser/Thr protein kinase)
MNRALLTVAIRYEQDVVVARQRARHIASLIGFDGQDQTRIATAVSEIARNAYRYAQGGRVEFAIEGQSAPQLLLIRVLDQGPGIADLERIMRGEYQSQTGMGLGIVGAHRLMDQVEIRSVRGQGTDVLLKKILSNMSHEFRTPLNSIQALSRLLLGRLDGPLSAEQDKQVHFISKAAARRARPCMIFLDLSLPDLGGEEVLESLKSDADLQQVPVAIVTAGRLSNDQRERLGRRAQAVLQKSELDADRARALMTLNGL